MAPEVDERQRLAGTDLIHADEEFHGPEVAPSISVTSTFRVPLPPDSDPPKEGEYDPWNPIMHQYSRRTQSISTRAERVLRIKYFGGHSDLLCGALVLWAYRTFLGSVMGSLEAWLLLRSLGTLHLRVPHQSKTAAELAHWLHQAAGGRAVDGIPAGMIQRVWHSSLQGKDARSFDPQAQMEGGWNATFSILLTNAEYARLLPHSLTYFVPATSLGAVESLIEYHVKANPKADPRLIRLSIGVEDMEDLKNDLQRASRRSSGQRHGCNCHVTI